ncbi:hypothetical protein KRR39_15495 [Nocardioides panacis]|uniref:Uncharacterized protein n=1 Tax=Nocardioides panacis TaxID=2849501 RepID=A0A975SW56_9ACTN|nr:hypothetical protein [Nocardioides panacis]QWZ06912.1 hypothetical protein KRR39_15495 [Nocardioides panacis]
MSTHDEDRLAHGLRERAGDVQGAPVGLADVQRSARGIQRRRRAVGGVVAAVVLAVAVPVGLNAATGPRADRPAAPATTSPSVPPVTPSPSRRTGEPVPLTVSGAPTGAPAALAYLRGTTVLVPGADPAELPAAYDTVAAYRGGWLAVQRRQGTPYVVHLDASGQVLGSRPGGDRIVVSQDGVEVSWVEGDRLYLDTTNGHSEQPRSIALPAGASASPVGFVGPGAVLARVDGPEDDYWVTSFEDFQVVRGLLSVRATDESHGVLGAQTSYSNQTGTSCWALRTDAGGDPEPKTCDWTIERFSADGAHFAGYPSGTDGLGSAAVALLDSATATPVVTFQRRGDGVTFVADVAWEDGTHALASLYEDGRWYLVRLGLDGSLERLDEAPGAPEESPFHFAARP